MCTIYHILHINYAHHVIAPCFVLGVSQFHACLRLRQNGRHIPDDIFKCIFLYENFWISIKIPLNMLNFVAEGPINNIPVLVQIMAWRQSGDKPLSETVMVGLLMHICIPLPSWVKASCLLAYLLTYLLAYLLTYLLTYLLIRVPSLTQGQSYDCPCVTEGTLNNMGITVWYQINPQITVICMKNTQLGVP